MKKSDFKEFNPVYLDTCKKIIEQKGACINIWCGQCPFDEFNSINKTPCYNVYAGNEDGDVEDDKLVRSAKAYLKLYANEIPQYFSDLQQQAYNIAKEKGFDLSSDVVQLLLIGTEISEALENFDVNIPNRLKPVLERFTLAMQDLEWLRKNVKLSDNSQLLANNNLPEELADIVIRVMSYAGARRIDLQKEIVKKLNVNEQRPVLHGKKF